MSKPAQRIARSERFVDDNIGAQILISESIHGFRSDRSDTVLWEVEMHHMEAATSAIVSGSSASWDSALTDATETARKLRTIFPKA